MCLLPLHSCIAVISYVRVTMRGSGEHVRLRWFQSTLYIPLTSGICMSKITLFVALALLVVYFVRSNANKKAAAENIRAGIEFMAANKSKEGVQTTASGLQYQVLTEGTGVEHPTANSRVRVHYHGTLLDGTVFDSSVDRGESIAFGLN